MDFKELLNVADYNKSEAKYEASVKRYSSALPPPKKLPKSGVQSAGIKAFLDKKKAEEEARLAEAQRKKQELLALRAQNSKNNKKAKIMASRTKDNDFSRIRLTEDEVEAKKKREAEIVRQNLANKVERMKARIELEEKEKLLPKKRKRKSKHDDAAEEVDNHKEDMDQDVFSSNKNDKNRSDKNKIHKPNRPAPPSLSFSELLKVAAQKQHEPVEVVVKKKEEEKLMTKKEKRMMEEERARLRRKEQMMQERLISERLTSKGSKNMQREMLPSTSVSKKTVPQKQKEQNITRNPVIVHVESPASSKPQMGKVKITKSISDSSRSVENNKCVPPQRIKEQNIRTETPVRNSLVSEKNHMNKITSEQKKKLSFSAKSEVPDMREQHAKKKMNGNKNGIKQTPVSLPPQTPVVPPTPAIDVAAIEKKIRENIEREFMEKFAAKIENLQKLQMPEKNAPVKKTEKPINVPSKAPPPIDKNLDRQISRKEFERYMAAKKAEAAKKAAAKPQKKPFHSNPYLDPPRRLLEPMRPQKPPPKRRLESDDDDDDDDDDMSDFIDDRPSQNDEDYSKYIKEIFNYDKSRYQDDDDDDIVESSYVEMQKEEIRSAKLGYLEDLEEEKKLREMEKKKKKKIKR